MHCGVAEKLTGLFRQLRHVQFLDRIEYVQGADYCDPWSCSVGVCQSVTGRLFFFLFSLSGAYARIYSVVRFLGGLIFTVGQSTMCHLAITGGRRWRIVFVVKLATDAAVPVM